MAGDALVQHVRTDTRTRVTTDKTREVIERALPGPATVINNPPDKRRKAVIAKVAVPIPAAIKMRPKIASTRDAVLKHFTRDAQAGFRRARVRIPMMKLKIPETTIRANAAVAVASIGDAARRVV